MKVRVLPGAYLPPVSAALLDRKSVKNKELRAAVIRASPGRFVIGAGTKDLAKIGAKPGPTAIPLTIRFPDGDEKLAYYGRLGSEGLAEAPLALSVQRHWQLDAEILVVSPTLEKKLPFDIAQGAEVVITLAKQR